MLTNKKITVLFIIFFAVIFLIPETVFAQTAGDFGVDNLSAVNLGNQDLQETIAGIINIFLGFLGILATLIILYAGFLWMTSGGNAEKIDKAKRILINGVIGLIIILSSYAITTFIFKEGFDGIFGNGNGGNGGGNINGVGLGAGALESHYPAPNASDIPRNTHIYATFKEPINIDFVVAGNCIGPDAQGITTCDAHEQYIRLFAQGNAIAITGSNLRVSYDDTFMTFKFDPYGDPDGNIPDYLGSPNTNVRYRMDFGDLQTENDQSAFVSGGYAWFFTTGTELDTTPPTVISVRPVQDASSPRNAVIQINFSEAINPYFVTGASDRDGLAISMTNNTNNPATEINGTYYISNQYRTVEFITNNPCGINSCGGEVFCLDPEILVAGLVGQAVQDMAANALGSDYEWTFTTTNHIDLTAPTISSMQDITNLGLDEAIEVIFSEPLLASSINSTNIDLTGLTPVDYWFNLNNGNTVVINHSRLDPSSWYTPRMTSGIKDLNQNCWYPCSCDAADASCVCNTDASDDCVDGDHCEVI